MDYLGRSTRSDRRLMPCSLEEHKVGNQLMCVPYGATEKIVLPEFTGENMGVPEIVNNVTVLEESESEAECQEVTHEHGSAASESDATASSTTPSRQFKDHLQPGDHVLVFDFNEDGKWVNMAAIVSEGNQLDTWKIKVGNVTRDIGKVYVVRNVVKPATAATPVLRAHPSKVLRAHQSQVLRAYLS